MISVLFLLRIFFIKIKSPFKVSLMASQHQENKLHIIIFMQNRKKFPDSEDWLKR